MWGYQPSSSMSGMHQAQGDGTPFMGSNGGIGTTAPTFVQLPSMNPLGFGGSDTPSVPIPRKAATDDLGLDLGFREYGLESEENSLLGSASGISIRPGGFGGMMGNPGGVPMSNNAPLPTLWGPIKMEVEDESSKLSDGTFRMDDDDIFQVDKADLIQGPTLAELNANDDTLLEDLSFDDLLLPEEKSLGGARVVMVDSPVGVEVPGQPMNAAAAMGVTSSSAPGPLFFLPSVSSSSFPPSTQSLPRDAFMFPTTVSPQRPGAVPSPMSPLVIDSSSPGSPAAAMTVTTTPPPPPSSSSPHHQHYLRHHHHHHHHPHHPPLSHHHHGHHHHHHHRSSLHELLLLKKDASSPIDSPLGRSAPRSSSSVSAASALSVANPLLTARLSSSAPTHLGLEMLWQRREPRPHLLSSGSLVESPTGAAPPTTTESTASSLSALSALSPASRDDSEPELDSDSDDDYDYDTDHHYEDLSDDDWSDGGTIQAIASGSVPMMVGDDPMSPGPSGSKRERYFWQYNVQAKGPKGQRLVLSHRLEDPHVLHEPTDPVFAPQCSIQGIKHSGKARKGDGNDLTPNPRKLFSIGRELERLSKEINDMTPVSELPFNARPKSRKEKNKLASRACRLKKKAQHEANKLKLYGLEQEHKRLMQCIAQAKQLVVGKCQSEAPQEELTHRVERLHRHCANVSRSSSTENRIAGHTTDFVNKVLDKVKSGTSNGGLHDI